MSPAQEALKARIASAAARVTAANGTYSRWKARCAAAGHAYKETSYGGATCEVCEDMGGWWCPDSPTHLCVYSKDFDCCDFCGAPEERK